MFEGTRLERPSWETDGDVDAFSLEFSTELSIVKQFFGVSIVCGPREPSRYAAMVGLNVEGSKTRIPHDLGIHRRLFAVGKLARQFWGGGFGEFCFVGCGRQMGAVLWS